MNTLHLIIVIIIIGFCFIGYFIINPAWKKSSALKDLMKNLESTTKNTIDLPSIEQEMEKANLSK